MYHIVNRGIERWEWYIAIPRLTYHDMHSKIFHENTLVQETTSKYKQTRLYIKWSSCYLHRLIHVKVKSHVSDKGP